MTRQLEQCDKSAHKTGLHRNMMQIYTNISQNIFMSAYLIAYCRKCRKIAQNIVVPGGHLTVT